MDFVQLVVALVVFCLVWIIIDKLPLPPPMSEFKWVAYVILALLVIFWLLTWAGMLPARGVN